MNYITVGINHKTAPIEIREKLSLDKESQQKVFTKALNSPFIQEAIILSTCNRVEIYGVTTKPEEAAHLLSELLTEPYQKEAAEQKDWSSILYSKKGADAINHLFHVVSSLDSQVVGENQITAQVREAYQIAQDFSATGYYLNKLFERALFVAKRVKTETDISKGNVSIGSVAVVLAKKIFGSLKNRSLLLLGAGKIGKTVVRHLKEEAPEDTFILNRTFSKAQALQEEGLGKAVPPEELSQLLNSIDVIITSATGNVPELSLERLKEIMGGRKNQPLFIIDLGMPRNVSPKASSVDNVYLYNLDDLKSITEKNKNNRDLLCHDAKNIIEEEAALFYENCLAPDVLPTISGLGNKFETIRKTELKKSLAKLVHLSQNDIEKIDKLTQSVVSKILHDPVLSLKTQKETTKPEALSLFKKLFRLDDETS